MTTERTMTVSLPDRQANRIEAAVEAGSYASTSDVVRAALRLWERHEELRLAELAQLKKAFEEGIAGGPGRSVTADTLLMEFKAKAGKSG